MTFSPQSHNEDALLASDEGLQYNNGTAEDERMGYGSDNDHSTGEELEVGDQDLDYEGLDRVLASQRRRSGGRGPANASQPHNVINLRGRRRSVGGVRLFTTTGRSGGDIYRREAAEDGGVEDITAVGSPTSAFSPVLQTGSIPISPAPTELQPASRRPRIPRITGKWTNAALRDAMAVVDGGMSMKKASDL